MVLAVMQPYFLPYLGYFQLINYADKFVVYDDVNFIKQGWINRNNFLVNKQAHLLNIQVADISSFRSINQHELKPRGVWDVKFLKTIEMAYGKAPFFNEVFPLVVNIIHFPSQSLSEFVHHSITEIAKYLEIQTEIVRSSTIYNNTHLKAQERIIDICKQEKANEYVNMAGGMELYSQNAFQENGIKLTFLKSNPFRYKQFSGEFIPYLSIIDVLMFNGKSNRADYLSDFQLF